MRSEEAPRKKVKPTISTEAKSAINPAADPTSPTSIGRCTSTAPSVIDAAIALAIQSRSPLHIPSFNLQPPQLPFSSYLSTILSSHQSTPTLTLNPPSSPSIRLDYPLAPTTSSSTILTSLDLPPQTEIHLAQIPLHTLTPLHPRPLPSPSPSYQAWASLTPTTSLPHYDSRDNLLLLHAGEKIVTLYPGGRGVTVNDVWDVFSNHCVNEESDEQYTITMRPGEALIIPSYTPHSVVSTTQTVAVNAWFDGESGGVWELEGREKKDRAWRERWRTFLAPGVTVDPSSIEGWIDGCEVRDLGRSFVPWSERKSFLSRPSTQLARE